MTCASSLRRSFFSSTPNVGSVAVPASRSCTGTFESDTSGVSVAMGWQFDRIVSLEAKMGGSRIDLEETRNMLYDTVVKCNRVELWQSSR